ncbi:hypothetical protein GCM10010124_25840 [Pilimelia terevasa]|uniref:Uncharacterized protein n=1 Tax=Pilimelia terevasa TaxID=53372 RepID=A0A8J3BMB4_9ACTN|nr:hypothetical protein [Pilimelia terevasa]GGK31899.1 hypothetical protein GCM10010124_25840 [Pilimelia terevasa]
MIGLIEHLLDAMEPDDHPGGDETWADQLAAMRADTVPLPLDGRPATSRPRAVGRVEAARVRAHRWLHAGFPVHIPHHRLED